MHAASNAQHVKISQGWKGECLWEIEYQIARKSKHHAQKMRHKLFRTSEYAVNKALFSLKLINMWMMNR